MLMQDQTYYKTLQHNLFDTSMAVFIVRCRPPTWAVSPPVCCYCLHPALSTRYLVVPCTCNTFGKSSRILPNLIMDEPLNVFIIKSDFYLRVVKNYS